MYIICSDLEGVFVPEIWINVSKHTGIDELKLTTRDIDDYNQLMRRRLDILREYRITIHDIQHVISYIKPYTGASELITWIKKRAELIVVSDTFSEFAYPIMQNLGHPTLFCNYLTTDHLGNITDYHLRQTDGKRKVVEAMQNLDYKVIAIGDSFNDINMLRKADTGILYRPPQNVMNENPDLTVVNTYEEIKEIILAKVESVY